MIRTLLLYLIVQSYGYATSQTAIDENSDMHSSRKASISSFENNNDLKINIAESASMHPEQEQDQDDFDLELPQTSSLQNIQSALKASFFRKTDALILVDLLLTPPLLGTTYYGKDQIEAAYACFPILCFSLISRNVHQILNRNLRHLLNDDDGRFQCWIGIQHCIFMLTAYVSLAQIYSIKYPCNCGIEELQRSQRILTLSIVSVTTNSILSLIDFILIGDHLLYRWKQRQA